MTLSQELLDRITRLLNQDATNYTVFFHLYQVPLADSDGSNDLSACVRKALNAEAEIGGSEEIAGADLLAEMEALLRFSGDPGAGPDASVLQSNELSSLLTELRESTSKLTHLAKKIERFWFKTGHPAYPVFWDFAYSIVVEGQAATILIGSSSD
jgi:hypothetical protein